MLVPARRPKWRATPDRPLGSPARRSALPVHSSNQRGEWVDGPFVRALESPKRAGIDPAGGSERKKSGRLSTRSFGHSRSSRSTDRSLEAVASARRKAIKVLGSEWLPSSLLVTECLMVCDSVWFTAVHVKFFVLWAGEEEELRFSLFRRALSLVVGKPSGKYGVCLFCKLLVLTASLTARSSHGDNDRWTMQPAIFHFSFSYKIKRALLGVRPLSSRPSSQQRA
jgi:hypothetical protein